MLLNGASQLQNRSGSDRMLALNLELPALLKGFWINVG